MTSGRCGPEALVDLIGGRWTLGVLAGLAAEGQRYQDLHKVLDGVSHKVLTETLRRAERDGLISRRLDSGRTGTATLYELTDLGRSLDEPLGALGRWADASWHLVEAARRTWSKRRPPPERDPSPKVAAW
jgi:DNA-binding HxlR family transcriptional regulator